MGLAQRATLELNGRATLQRADQSVQNYNRAGTPALNLTLAAGDRLCVTQGSGKLTFGVKNFALEAGKAACFEVAKPKSFWDSLVASCQDIGVCKQQAQAAFVREAKSRDLEGGVPYLFLPADYALTSLTLTVAAGRTLRLLGEGNKELARLEGSEKFAVPTEQLRGAARVEVRNASDVVVYSSPLRWVNFASDVTANNPKEAALALWTTGDVSYAPAAYSYLLAAGDAELAALIETQVRREFRGTIR
ncbi:MAG: hypothetical protein SFU83_19250 [Meiothermus sp.]|nr:hypothetical protein [Meiothermus sp.]